MTAQMSTPTGKCLCTAEKDSKGRMAFKMNPDCPWAFRPISEPEEVIRDWGGNVIYDPNKGDAE